MPERNEGAPPPREAPDKVARAKAFCEELLRRLGGDVALDVKESAEAIGVSLTPRDGNGLELGGALVEAMQYLVNRVVNPRAEGRKWVNVDVGGFSEDGDPAVKAMAVRLAATAVLAEACGTGGLIGGQVMDLESEGRAIDTAALERLHRAKTGALLTACVRGGAILGSARPNELEALSRYADAVGLAFQVVDDVLDATESAERLGKTAGKDAAAHKATYVSLHGIERARELASGLLRDALAALEPLGPRAALLAALARLVVDRHS